MTELNKPENKVAAEPTKWLIRFIVIFCIVFVSQVPGCVVVLADDAGQIDYFEYENLIKFSTVTFAFPLRQMIMSTYREGTLMLLYFGNLLLLTCMVILIMITWKIIRKRRSGVAKKQ